MTDTPIALPQQPANFDAAVRFTLSTVAPASAAVYASTYAQWTDFCHARRLHPLDLRPLNVVDFLTRLRVTKRTRQRHLAALRTLARTLALDPRSADYRAIYEALRLLKAPEDDLGGNPRPRRALNSRQVTRILDSWAGDSLIDRRNQALVALLFYTGMRRAEIAALRWQDIDFDEGVIHVRAGKGDRPREAAVVDGQHDLAIWALKAWRYALIGATGEARQYVFCRIRKGDKPGADRPLNVSAVNQIIARTGAQASVHFTPHDARRTLGTELLAGSFPLADVQAQLGHAHASTTLQHYALPADARKRRGRFKVSY